MKNLCTASLICELFPPVCVCSYRNVSRTIYHFIYSTLLHCDIYYYTTYNIPKGLLNLSRRKTHDGVVNDFNILNISSSRFSINSEAIASELIENQEEMFPCY